MATKAELIKTITSNDADWTDAELKTLSVAVLTKMAAPFSKSEKSSAAKELTKDDLIAAIIDSGKYNEFDSETLESMPIAVLTKMNSKLTSTNVTSNGAPKQDLPVKPELKITDATIVARVRKYLTSAKPMPVGHHEFPKNKAGQAWQTSTVHNIVLESLTDLGFSNADQWAKLFVQGSLDISEFNKAVQFATLESRMKRAAK